MKRKIVLILASVFSAMSLSADTIERLSAIKSDTPWDNKAIGIYDYLTTRTATAIIDISDSTNPILTYKTTGSFKWSEGLDILDALLFVNRVPDFWIGRIFPPDSIVLIAYYDLVNPNLSLEPWGIEARDTILYIANGDEGLYIFNVKDPTNPTQITFYDTPGNLTNFFILDSLIYLADCDSVIILNISNPASPQYVGAVHIPRKCTDVYVVYPYAYATCWAYDWGNGADGSVKIIDISNPSSPTIIGSIDGIRGDPRAVFVNDDYIYVAATDWWFPPKKKGRADVEGGIRVAQGQVPDSLIISYDTPGNPREIFVRGNLLLVPDSDSLQILYHHKTGIEEGENKTIPLISKFFVFPNPSRNRITCKLQFKKSARITVSVYDESGRKVRDIYRGPIISGPMRFFWDGRDNNKNIVTSAKYFIRVSTEDGKYTETRKVIYLGGEK